jgi:hypothetical protein
MDERSIRGFYTNANESAVGVGAAEIEERFHCAKNAQWGGGLSPQADRFIGMNRKTKSVGLFRSK